MNPSNPINPCSTILLLGVAPKLAAHLENHVADLGCSLCVEQDANDFDPFSTCPDLAVIGPGLNVGRLQTLTRALKVQDPLMPVLVLPDSKKGEEAGLPGWFEGVQRIETASSEFVFDAIKSAFARRETSLSGSELPVLIGRSRQMNEIRRRIEAVSGKEITVLITGETGTGKEMIARSLHYFSHRHAGPLVKISCGNLPDQLLESEVFGFQKGAFTDAYRNKPGRLELADRGTLFLDEIGDLPLSLQVKFLQVFEDRAFARLGATDERVIDARVVAATNRDLGKKVREGEFRQDLFYRLNVVHIKTPPLRERREDVPLLVKYFLKKYCSLLKRGALDIPESTLNLLMAYHWPGNVRELENLVRRAIVLQNWEFLKTELRPLDCKSSDLRPPTSDLWPHDPVAEYFSKGVCSLRDITNAYVSEVERKSIVEALRSVRWNRRKAAQVLGVSYKTLCNRIKELGLEQGTTTG